jgi:hypothetical protein
MPRDPLSQSHDILGEAIATICGSMRTIALLGWMSKCKGASILTLPAPSSPSFQSSNPGADDAEVNHVLFWIHDLNGNGIIEMC